MKLPYIDRIWRVRDSLTIDPPQLQGEVFSKMDGLFKAEGTSHLVDGDTLTFTKKDPLAQDRMAIYNKGNLQLIQREQTSELHWDMSSPTLMFCFVLPFFFLAIAGVLEESRKSAFVFAGIFATLYIVGRILEPWLIKKAFQKAILGEEAEASLQPSPAPDCDTPVAG